MATREHNLTRLFDRSRARIADVLAVLADETMALGGDDPHALEAARRWAQAARDLAPSSRRTLLSVARTLAQRGDHDAALRALRAVLARAPRDAEVLHEMAMIREEQGEVVEARRLLQRAIRNLQPARQPWGALVYLSISEIEAATGQRDRALRWARQGIQRLSKAGLDTRVLRDFLSRTAGRREG